MVQYSHLNGNEGIKLISHNHAHSLEIIVRGVYHCDSRGGMEGILDANHFERKPFDAALLALAPYYLPYGNAKSQEIAAFIDLYSTVFDYPEENLFGPDADKIVERYVTELERLVLVYVTAG